jgi:hypothetical protein
MQKIRVQNISAITRPPNGQMIDYHGTIISPNRYAILSVEVVDHDLERWREQGLIKISDADSGTVIGGSALDGAVTAGTRLREANGEQDLDIEEEEFDLSDAKDAVLPPIQSHPGIIQDEKSGAKVSLGSEEETFESTLDLSPIPGDRPRTIDNADKFTIKAPRQQHTGGIISNK